MVHDTKSRLANIPFSPLRNIVNVTAVLRILVLSAAASLLAMITLQVVPGASATVIAQGVPNGPVAHWSFEEGTGATTADISGNGHTGALVNGASWAIGQLGTAVSLDGFDDYIEVTGPGAGSNLDFGIGDTITITAWAKRNSTGSWQPIVNKNGSFANQRNYELSYSGGGLNTASDSVAFVFQATSNNWVAFSSDTTYADLNWHHFALIHTFGDSSSTQLYVDGMLVSASWKFGDGSWEAYQGDGPLRIGATEISSERIHGLVDDVRLFRRALSQAEVVELFTSGGGTTASVATPTITPDGGTLPAPVEVTLSTTTLGATIYYTTDGATPTETSPQYTAPLSLTSDTTVKAKAYKDGMDPSGVASASFKVTVDTTPPTIDSATASGNENQVIVVFSEAVDSATANTAGNYAISPGVTVSAASLGADSKTGTLTTSTLSTGTAYTLTVNNVMDQSGIPILVDSQVNFTFISGNLTIDIWYGSQQKFGNVGKPQVWVDILGNALPASDVASLTFSLNGGADRSLNIGPDGRRLAMAGDFNAQIPITDLVPGLNSVVITATGTSGPPTQATVTVDYTAGNVWPATYEVDWSAVTDIQDVAQIVDGVWTVDPQGIRNVQIGYDRLFAIGDVTWEDYEVEFPMTVHNSFPFESYSGAGLIIRWQGHSNGGAFCEQPVCGWVPYGNEVWYRWTESGGISDNFGRTLQENSGRVLQYNVPYIYKVRVESVEGQDALYSMKIWVEGEAEPVNWDAQGFGTQGVSAGSILFIAHLTDVTIGNINIVPVVPKAGAPIINPDGGTFVGSVTVSISSPTVGSAIRYTTDGSEPTMASPQYTDPSVLTNDVTVKARAYLSGINPSDVTSAGFTILADTTPPTIESVKAFGDPNHVKVVFDELVDTTTPNNAVNYAISDGVAISSANLAGDFTTVTLATSALLEGVAYTLTVNDVADRSGNAIATNSQMTFDFIPVNVPDGLVAYWPFDDGLGSTAVDLSGNGHTGTLVNGPVWTTGLMDNALQFDGTDSYVDVGNVDVAGNAVSFTAWFKSDNLANCVSIDCRIISKTTGTASQNHYWMVSTISSSGIPRLRFRLKTGGSTQTLIASSGDLTPGQWTFVAAVYDGSTMTLYKDGVAVGSTAKTGNVDVNNAVSVWIGGNPPDPTARPWDGAIEDVRIYDRGLSFAEVQELFTSVGDVLSPVAAPAISPDGGTFTGSVEVTLSTATPGAAIHYTTDGRTPAITSNEYTAPVLLAASATVKAKAFKTGADPSAVASATFIVDTDTIPPNLGEATAFGDPNSVSVVFDEPLDSATANNAGNYAITDGVNNVPVSSANLEGDSKTLTLTTGTLVVDTAYTLTVNNVEDESGNVIAANSETTFQFSQISVPDGLVAYWSFDEGVGSTTADLSGNGHTGTLINGPVWTTGLMDNALRFDGTASYVDVGNIDVTGNAISLTAWFKSDNFANCGSHLDCRIVSKATGTAGQDHYWMVSTISSGGIPRLRFRLRTGGSTLTLIAALGDLTPGQWTFVAAVYDGATMTIYKDGVLVGGTVKSGNLDVNSAVSAWIGGNPPKATEQPWDGVIDDVRIYNRGLSVAEVQELFAGGSGA